MRDAKKRAKKLAKKRKLRMDFERRKNINKHVPTEVVDMEKTIHKPVVNEKGEQVYEEDMTPLVRVVGKRIVTKRIKKERKKDSDGKDIPLVSFPKRRKYKMSKEAMEMERKASKHAAVSTASGR